MDSERGQASVDYVAIIAVLAIVFGLALTSVAVGAPGIVNAVTGQFRHALCLVGGGPCPDWRSKPCAVATERDASHFAVTVLIVRYDKDKYVLRERMSDGTVRLTVADTHGLGLEGGFGANAHVTIKGRDIGATDEARVAVQLLRGTGKTYVARNEREADAYMKVIEAGVAPAKPKEDFWSGGIRASGKFGLGNTAAGLSLDGLASTVIGGKHDRSNRDLTLTLDLGRSGSGALRAGLGGPTGAFEGNGIFGLTLDRKHRAKELSISLTGTGSGGLSLPLLPKGSLGNATLNAGGTQGHRWELDIRLDLRDPLVADAWARFRHDPTSGDAIQALGDTIRDHARLDVRNYRMSGSSGGGGAGVAEGVRVAGEYEHSDDRGTLVDASSRPPAGLWEPRLDCV